MLETTKKNIVYVIGAGFSAGLGFPTVENLLCKMWPRIEKAEFSDELIKVIQFHHPNFKVSKKETFPNIEQLLSGMDVNIALFESSRPAAGGFKKDMLKKLQKKLLLEITNWFHELQYEALKNKPKWLDLLTEQMNEEKAVIISFNWDLVLDQLLFDDELCKQSYGLDRRTKGMRLIKPHGSLNWHRNLTGKYLKKDRKFLLFGKQKTRIYAFLPFRPVKSSKRDYTPLIIPPTYMKTFKRDLFRRLWQDTVSALSTATEVRFLGYSLPIADFHSKFILRCSFYNQENGELKKDGTRMPSTGKATVTVVDPSEESFNRIKEAVGMECKWQNSTIEDWIAELNVSQSTSH